jgi:hypothetical protein
LNRDVRLKEENCLNLCMLRLKSELKGAFLTIAGLLLLLFFLWIWIGIRVGIWTWPQYQRHVWLVETTPVAYLLWSHQINAGDSAADLSRDWPPDLINQFGPWKEMTWVPGGARDDELPFIDVGVVAKNGRLVSAAACSDDGLNDRTFFDTETTNDKPEYNAAFEAYVERQDAERTLLATNFPILQALWRGNIMPGTNAEKIIETWHPLMTTQFGHWMILRWFPENPSPTTRQVLGVRMIARNGFVVCANSFSDDGHCSTYFDTEAPQDKEDFDTEYEQSIAAKISYRTNSTR